MRSAVATCSKTVHLPIDLDTVAAALLFDGSGDGQIRLDPPSIWRADGMPFEFSQQSLDLVAGLEHLGARAQHFIDRELSQ